MREFRRLWEPRGGNWSRSKVREDFLEEGMSALRHERRVPVSLLREREGNCRTQDLPVPRTEVSKPEPGLSAESKIAQQERGPKR